MNLKNVIYDFLYPRIWNIHNRQYPPPSPDDCQNLDLKIFVLTHTDGDLPEVFSNRNIYVPLRMNNQVNPTKRGDWLTDDMGENISQYNLLINEITGIWWVAKHYAEIGNPSFVGFNHYRRFLQWHPTLLKEGTVISTSGFYPTKRLWQVSIRQPRNLFRERFMEKFDGTDLVSWYDKYWNGHVIYYSNLFITDKSTFFRYFHFLEECLSFIFDMIQNKAVDLQGYTPYQRRVYSFFLEHMTSFWIFYEKEKSSIRHIPTCQTYFDIPNLNTSIR